MAFTTGDPIRLKPFIDAVTLFDALDAASPQYTSAVTALQGLPIRASQGDLYILGAGCAMGDATIHSGGYFMRFNRATSPALWNVGNDYFNHAGIVQGNAVRVPLVVQLESSSLHTEAAALAEVIGLLNTDLAFWQGVFPGAILYGYGFTTNESTVDPPPDNWKAVGFGLIGMP